MVSGLRFVWLEVANLDRSLRFYRDGLGLRVEEMAPDAGRRMASVEAGELELALVECSPSDPSRGSGVRLYLNAHDVDYYRKGLRDRGVAAGEPVEEAWGGRVVTVADPDGYTLCFVQSRHQMMPDEP